MISFRTSDNVLMAIPREYAERAMTVSNLLGVCDGASDEEIPLPNVSSTVLKKISAYLEYHQDENEPGEHYKYIAPIYLTLLQS